MLYIHIPLDSGYICNTYEYICIIMWVYKCYPLNDTRIVLCLHMYHLNVFCRIKDYISVLSFGNMVRHLVLGSYHHAI